MIRYFLYILICFFITSSCKKKFEEGPLISFRSAKKRIAGDWSFEKYFENGEDKSTLLLNDTAYTGFFFSNYEYKLLELKGKNNHRDAQVGSYSLKKDLLRLSFSVDSINHLQYGHDFLYPFFTTLDTVIELKVLRLTNRELKIESNLNGKQQITTLKK